MSRWTRNPGRCPSEAEGKRVRVRLRNGTVPDASWAADGRHGCRWSIDGLPFDILQFEVVR